MGKKDMEHPGSLAEHNNRILSEYTYEDYLKDFELDYLGFDGVPDKPVPHSETDGTCIIKPQSENKQAED